jgi:hypothetical protein
VVTVKGRAKLAIRRANHLGRGAWALPDLPDQAFTRWLAFGAATQKQLRPASLAA